MSRWLAVGWGLAGIPVCGAGGFVLRTRPARAGRRCANDRPRACSGCRDHHSLVDGPAEGLTVHLKVVSSIGFRLGGSPRGELGLQRLRNGRLRVGKPGPVLTSGVPRRVLPGTRGVNSNGQVDDDRGRAVYPTSCVGTG